MTHEQAINILSNVCSQFRGTIEEHKILQLAIETVKDKPSDKTDATKDVSAS